MTNVISSARSMAVVRTMRSPSVATGVKGFCPRAGSASSERRLMRYVMRLLHKGESLCCFRDSASVTYGCMLPSDLPLSVLRFILSAKSGQSCLEDCETVDFCNSLVI